MNRAMILLAGLALGAPIDDRARSSSAVDASGQCTADLVCSAYDASFDDLDVADQITVARVAYESPPTATVSANAASLDLSGGDLQLLDLQGSTGTVTVTVSNPATGQAWAARIQQGDNGDTITWSPVLHCPGGPCADTAITVTEDAIDLLTCVYDGSAHLCSLQQDIKGT